MLETITDYELLADSYERSGQPYADVLLVDSFWAHGARARDELEPIPTKLIQRDQIVPGLQLDGAVPAYAYAMVSSFRRDVSEQTSPPNSWKEWWDTQAYAGFRSLPKNPLGSFEFALLASGVERAQLYPLDIDRAIEQLDTIRDNIGDLWWESGDQPILWMDRARAHYAAAWHHRVAAAQFDGRAMDFVWDDALLVVDHWIVPRGGASVDIALDFIAYATTPDVQASLASSVPLGPINRAAFDLIDARTAILLPTAPNNLSKTIQADVSWWSANETVASERFDEWLREAPVNET